MSNYIYLSTTPEALIASMLPPSEFGAYMATGTKKRNFGQAIFFEIDYEQIKSLVNEEYIRSNCVRKPNGTPKSSVYLSVYRVLELIPLNALKSLYLTADNGNVLELKPIPYNKSKEKFDVMHLYQEICPITPQVVSTLTPSEFLQSITNEFKYVFVPKLFFVELKLGNLATDPISGSAENLPYTNIGHLRDCLEILRTEENKYMKTVQRFFSGSLLYRTINSGFYVGNKDDIVFYPYPTLAELETINYEFFRSI